MYDRMTHLLLIGSNLSQANRWVAIGQKSCWQNYQPLKTPNLHSEWPIGSSPTKNWTSFKNTYVLNMFLKIPMFWKYLCFETSYVLKTPAFEKSEHPKKITFCVLIQLKFSLRSRVPKPTFRRSVTSKSPIVVPADLGVPETKNETEEDMF